LITLGQLRRRQRHQAALFGSAEALTAYDRQNLRH
jgi:hypothetical protein